MEVTAATRTFADAVVEDDGQWLRRVGVAVICASGALALLGFTALTLAYETYSGYAAQAVVALVTGLAGLGLGWSVLRRGDRLGPRLTVFPLLGRMTRFEPDIPVGARVRVHTQPIAALPAGPRSR